MFLRGGQCVTVHGLYTRKKLNLIHLKHIRFVSKWLTEFFTKQNNQKIRRKAIKTRKFISTKRDEFLHNIFFF